MEENREISYIVRMLLTTIGSYGIIRVLTSCALFQVSDMAVIFGILAAAVICVYGLYGRKKHFLIVTGFICRIVRFKFWHFKSRVLPHLQ